MNDSSFIPRWIVTLLAVACALPALGAEPGTLQVGAARVDITPPADAALLMGGYPRKQGFKGIHDHIYVRAIVLNDGTSYAAIVTWELVFVPTPVWSELSERVAKETGIPVENLMLAAVHNHSAPTVGRASGNHSKTGGAYTATVEDATIEAIRQAKAKMQPARVGIGTGKAYLNVNRRECAPGRGCRLGQNPDFPSDKTVAVVKFESMAGKPIALLINYAVHDVVMGPDNLQVTGDLVGATSRFVEQFYKGALTPTARGDLGNGLELRPDQVVGGDGVVALWTSGAAGDQNPISLARGEDFTLVDAFGKTLGEEAIRVAGAIRTTPSVRLRGAQREVSCPGRRAVSGQAAGAEPKFVDTDPAKIRLSLLMIGDIAVTGVSGEVLTMIGQRLKNESPYNHTIMVTHANGNAGYIPNDAAYDQLSYEVMSTRFKPGCAEGAIVNGLLDLIDQR